MKVTLRLSNSANPAPDPANCTEVMFPAFEHNVWPRMPSVEGRTAWKLAARDWGVNEKGGSRRSRPRNFRQGQPPGWDSVMGTVVVCNRVPS